MTDRWTVPKQDTVTYFLVSGDASAVTYSILAREAKTMVRLVLNTYSSVQYKCRWRPRRCWP